MNIYETTEHEDVVKALTDTLEKETGNTIFTIRILDEGEEGLDTIVVFNDQSVLRTWIQVQTVNGRLAMRMRGNYL